MQCLCLAGPWRVDDVSHAYSPIPLRLPQTFSEQWLAPCGILRASDWQGLVATRTNSSVARSCSECGRVLPNTWPRLLQISFESRQEGNAPRFCKKCFRAKATRVLFFFRSGFWDQCHIEGRSSEDSHPKLLARHVRQHWMRKPILLAGRGSLEHHWCRCRGRIEKKNAEDSQR